MLQNRTSSSHTLYSSHCLNLSCFPMQRTSIVSCLHFSRGINDFTRYKTLYRLERLNRICWTATRVLSKKVLETIFFSAAFKVILYPPSDKTKEIFCPETWFQEPLKHLKIPGKARHSMPHHKNEWNHPYFFLSFSSILNKSLKYWGTRTITFSEGPMSLSSG